MVCAGRRVLCLSSLIHNEKDHHNDLGSISFTVRGYPCASGSWSPERREETDPNSSNEAVTSTVTKQWSQRQKAIAGQQDPTLFDIHGLWNSLYWYLRGKSSANTDVVNQYFGRLHRLPLQGMMSEDSLGFLLRCWVLTHESDTVKPFSSTLFCLILNIYRDAQIVARVQMNFLTKTHPQSSRNLHATIALAPPSAKIQFAPFTTPISMSRPRGQHTKPRIQYTFPVNREIVTQMERTSQKSMDSHSFSGASLRCRDTMTQMLQMG